MAGGFKRSGRFGLIGVFAVAAIVVAIALTTGSGEANPKLTLGLIFGILAVFFVILFALQRADLDRAASGGARETARAVAEGARIENPMTMSEPELWAALAVKPIDEEAIRARGQMWESTRGSLRLGMVVVVLIFLTVPAIYLLESFVPLLIGGPLIAIAAVYGSVRALAPGGDLDRGYERVEAAMAPLGLEVAERPSVSIEMREPVTPRMGPKVEVTVAAPAGEFEARSRDGPVRPVEGAAAAIAESLAAVPNSTRWKKVRVEGGSDGIVVVREGGESSDWLADLWLAERLASC